MKINPKIVLKVLIGAIILIVGVAALFVPLVPGIALIALGLFLLGFSSRHLERVKKYIRKMFK